MKRIIGALLAAVLAFSALPTAALAESLNGKSNWQVTYTADGKMSDNYSSSEYVDDVSGLQPGDDITFTVNLSHENASAADWYLANDVVKTLEEGAAEGSAYEYLLSYSGPSTSRDLYDSRVVGGDNQQGLMEADSALQDYIYLDRLSKGQTAKITLKVTLDGETEGNAYFNTLARLKLKFAVEPEPEPTKRVERRVVQTGDERDTRLFPFYVAMVVSGVALAGFAAYSVHLRREDRKEGVR